MKYENGEKHTLNIVKLIEGNEFRITDQNEILLKKVRQTTVGRPIWEILEMIRVYKENNSTSVKAMEAVSLFCKKKNIAEVSKKSLDDYWNHIQKAYKYGFDFNRTNFFNHFGIVKNFV